MQILNIVLTLLLSLSFNSSIGKYIPIKSPYTHTALKNVTAKEIEKNFNALYNRLHLKDYGFAGYRESCDVTSTTDLEDHLASAKNITMSQDPDGKFHQYRTIQAKVRSKLQQFYHRSRNYCDFRKLLVCDKVSKRCSCPHSSMSMGKVGCEIHVGKSCNFSDSQLNQFGIPIILNETLNLKCEGDFSECVSSFGAADQICKCKAGFSFSSNGVMSCSKKIGGKNYEKFGESISKKQGMNNVSLQEYFLYPEQVKAELVKLMAIKDMFKPEERGKEADSLYSKIYADKDQEGMVIRDIFIRKAAIQKFGYQCDPHKQIVLNSPPLSKEGGLWVDPKPNVIKAWQLLLLQGGNPLCNFEQSLMCDDEKKVCQCKEGLFYGDGKCHLIPGETCGPDYNGVFEFNPLIDRSRFSPPLSPPCGSGAICEYKALFFKKQCWCEMGKTCAGTEITVIPPPEIEADVNGRFTLHSGDPCDPKAHSLLLNLRKQRMANYKERITILEKILGKNPPIQFCNLDKFLNCSESSKKCVCFNYLSEEGEECRTRNRDTCLGTYSQDLDFFPGVKMEKVELSLEKKFQPPCIHLAKCGSKDGKCSCTNGLDGDLCSDPKSIFASVLNPINVLGLDSDRMINSAFYALNFYTFEVEKLLTLKYNEKCDTSSDTMLQRIMQFYRDIGSSDENISGMKTLYQYKKTLKWIKFLIKPRINSTSELCNGFQGLHCDLTKEKCNCPKGLAFEGNKCTINVGEVCDAKQQISWMPSCSTNSECLQALFNFRYTCQCKIGWGGESCKESLINESNVNITGKGNCDDSIIEGECEKQSNNSTVQDIEENSFNEDQDYFTTIKAVLKKIMKQKSIPKGMQCNMQLEIIFATLFPSLPTFEEEDFDQLLLEPEKIYNKLLGFLSRPEYLFCDRRKFLNCNGGVCACDRKCRSKKQSAFCANNHLEHNATKIMGEKICLLYEIGKQSLKNLDLKQKLVE